MNRKPRKYQSNWRMSDLVLVPTVIVGLLATSLLAKLGLFNPSRNLNKKK